ncbi:MAG: 3-hydroxyacyl-CoA dehydrogenase NAD-binding domain-containing protein [Gammaproteobacteria bacterium]|nr:3-hydroxyacyl-CoA dehydrogenase NAD-binding domain-containing protein [Gammaproteobacteria bacterium]
MTEKTTNSIAHVTCIGTGLIGSGWAVHFLRAGLHVVAYDPNRNAEKYLRDTVDRAWPSVQKLGLNAHASVDRLQFTDDLPDALAHAQFVQESAPEDETLKMELLKQIDAVAAPDVVIASSSSSFLAGRLRSKCEAHPYRVLVGHPFNPPYLIPLVEVVGGGSADPQAVERAVQFYRDSGSRPIVLKKDILGYVANRLQLAVMREIFHLVAEDVSSVADIDDAIAYGPGLRWAIKGPCEIFMLASQRPDQFAQFIDLIVEEIDMGCVAVDRPTIREGVRETIVQGVGANQPNLSFEQRLLERDQKIIALRQTLVI